MRSEEIKRIFGNQIRVRVMGILVKNHQLLLVNHSGLNQDNELWLPPGGGVEVGERVVEALIREFNEEVKKSKLKIQYECITRSDRMNEEVIKVLKESGCFRVWIGAESGSQKVIDLMDRRVDVNNVRKMI